MTRLLAISGSLRANSTHTALLRAAVEQAPPDVAVTVYAGLGDLPIFNPDLAGQLPPAAVDLRTQVLAADGLLMASPEYAHGVTGGLKNALDWIVGWGEAAGKPVALFQASEYSGGHAHAALIEILTTMSLRIIPEAGLAVHLRGKSPEEMAAILAAPDVRRSLRETLAHFARAIRSNARV